MSVNVLSEIQEVKSCVCACVCVRVCVHDSSYYPLRLPLP